MKYQIAEHKFLAFLMAVGRKPWGGPLIALASVTAALILRLALDGFGHFFYLPMIPAVVATAMLTNRSSTALAILMSVALNLMLVPREDVIDAGVNAALFCVVSWSIAVVCWRQRAALSSIRISCAQPGGS